MNDKPKKTIKEVFDENPDGFSLNFKYGTLNTEENGYYVALTDNPTTRKDLETTYKKVWNFLKLLNVPDSFKIIGGWKEDNIYYLDASVWVLDKEDAHTLKRLFRQKALWDVENEEAI